MTLFALIHSPLTGPFVWAPVAARLAAKGLEAIVPRLPVQQNGTQPFWQLHANAVAKELRGIAGDQQVVLVGHSGAGPLLPAISAALDQRVAAYIFADASLPQDGKSRLEIIGEPFMSQFRARAQNGLVPPWPEQDLSALIPDVEIRSRFAADLPLMPFAVYDEPLPLFASWPDAPCGYLQFTAAYDQAASSAKTLGWPYRKLDAGHFHMLVAPQQVSDALVELVQQVAP